VLRTAPAPTPRPHPARSPDGTVEATIHGREVDVVDRRSGRVLHRLTGHRSLVTDAEFSPDGRFIVTASDDHLARIWDVRRGRLLRVLRGHFFAVRSASFSPDGRWVVTASQLTAGLWDASSGRLLQYLRGHTKPLTGASFSPDGRYIVTGGDDGIASIVRCEICAGLEGLEQTARERLAAIGR
jgi:WD40 repeat protein